MSTSIRQRAASVDSRGSVKSSTSIHSNWVCDNCFEFDRKDHKEKMYKNVLDRQIAQNNATRRNSNNKIAGVTGLLVGREMVEDPAVMLQEIIDKKNTLMKDFHNQIDTHQKNLQTQNQAYKSGRNNDMFANSPGHFDRIKDLAKRRDYMSQLDSQNNEKRARSEATVDRRKHNTGLNIGEVEDPTLEQIKSHQAEYRHDLLKQQELDRTARIKDKTPYCTSLETGNVDLYLPRRREAQRLQAEWKQQIENHANSTSRMSPEKIKDREHALRLAREGHEDAIRDAERIRKQQRDLRDDLNAQKDANENRRRQNLFHTQHPQLCKCAVCDGAKPNDMLRWLKRDQLTNVLNRKNERNYPNVLNATHSTSASSASSGRSPVRANHHIAPLPDQPELKHKFLPTAPSSNASESQGSTFRCHKHAEIRANDKRDPVSMRARN